MSPKGSDRTVTVTGAGDQTLKFCNFFSNTHSQKEANIILYITHHLMSPILKNELWSSDSFKSMKFSFVKTKNDFK